MSYPGKASLGYKGPYCGVTLFKSPANEAGAAFPCGRASEVRGAGPRRYVRGRLADLGLDKASQGLGLAKMVGYTGYPAAGVTLDRRASPDGTEKD